MEVEPLQVVFEQYEEQQRRVEKIYVKNALRQQAGFMRVEFKYFDESILSVQPQVFDLRSGEIKEVLIELFPMQLSSRIDLQNSLFLTATASNGYQSELRMPVIIKPKIPLQLDSLGSIRHLHPEILASITMRGGELEDRALRQILEEKEKLIERLEQRAERSEMYCSRLENVQRNMQIRERELEEEVFKRDIELKEIREERQNKDQLMSQSQQLMKESDVLRIQLDRERKARQQDLLRLEQLEAQVVVNGQIDLREKSKDQSRINESKQQISQLEAKLVALEEKKKQEMDLMQKYKISLEDMTKKYKTLQNILEQNEKDKLEEIRKDEQAAEEKKFIEDKKRSMNEDSIKAMENKNIISDGLLLVGNNSNNMLSNNISDSQKSQSQIGLPQGLVEELQKLRVKYSKAKLKYKNSKSEIKSLANQLSEQEEFILQLKADLKSTSKNGVNGRIAMVEKIKERFEEQLMAAQKKHQADLDRKQDALEQASIEIRKCKNDNQALSVSLQESQQQITALNERLLKMNNTLKRRNSTQQSLPKTKDKLTTETEERIEELEKQLQKIKTEKEDVERTAKKKQSIAERRLQEVETQKKEMEEKMLRSNLQSADNNVNNVSSSSNNINDKSTLIFDQTLKALRIENKELEKKYFEEIEAQKEMQNAFREKELDYCSRIEQLSRSLHDSKKRGQGLSRGELGDQGDHRNNTNESMSSASYEQALQQSINEVKLLQRELDEAQEHREQLASECLELRRQIDEKEQLGKQQEQENKRKHTADKLYRENIQGELSELQEFVKEMSRQKEHIEVQIELKDQALEEDKIYQSELISMMKELESKCEELESQLAAVSENTHKSLLEKNLQTDILQFNSQRAADKIMNLETDLEKEIQVNKELRQSLFVQQKKAATLESQISQYDKTKKKQMQTLRTQVNEQKQENALMEEEKETLAQEVDELHRNLVKSRGVYSLHLGLLKSKIETDFKEFYESTEKKLKFFIAKKDSLEMTTKVNKLLEKFLDNTAIIAEKDASIKILSTKVARNKSRYQQLQSAQQQAANGAVDVIPQAKKPHKYSLQVIAQQAAAVVAAQDIDKLIFELQDSQNNLEKLIGQAKDTQNQLSTSEDKAKHLQQQLVSSKNEMQSLRQLDKERQAESAVLSKRIAELENALKQNKQVNLRNTEEMKQLQRVRELNDVLREDVKKKEEEILELKKIAQEKQGVVVRLQKALAEQERREEYVTDMQMELKQAKSAEIAANDQNQMLSSQVATLKNDLLRKDLLLKHRQQQYDKSQQASKSQIQQSKASSHSIKSSSKISNKSQSNTKKKSTSQSKQNLLSPSLVLNQQDNYINGSNNEHHQHLDDFGMPVEKENENQNSNSDYPPFGNSQNEYYSQNAYHQEHENQDDDHHHSSRNSLDSRKQQEKQHLQLQQQQQQQQPKLQSQQEKEYQQARELLRPQQEQHHPQEFDQHDNGQLDENAIIDSMHDYFDQDENEEEEEDNSHRSNQMQDQHPGENEDEEDDLEYLNNYHNGNNDNYNNDDNDYSSPQ